MTPAERKAKKTAAQFQTAATFNPSPALLAKLGSALVHAEEYMSVQGHTLDREAFKVIADDPDVIAWLAGMRELGMLPVKR